jgi:hypothetical protein
VEVGIGCAGGDPSRNVVRTRTARKSQAVDLITDFRADGRKKLKFSGLVGARHVTPQRRMPGLGSHIFLMRRRIEFLVAIVLLLAESRQSGDAVH